MFKSLFDYCKSIIRRKYKYIVIILMLCLLQQYVCYMQIKILYINITMVFYLINFFILFLFTLFMRSLINKTRQNMLPFFDLTLISKNQKNLFIKIYFFFTELYYTIRFMFCFYITMSFIKAFYINTLTPKDFILYVETFILTYYFCFFLFYILAVFQFFFLNIKTYEHVRFFDRNLYYLCCLIFILIVSLCIIFK